MRTTVPLDKISQLVEGRHENPFELLGPHEVTDSGRKALAAALFAVLLATARALCLRPKVLLLDEPTEGLQPSMIEAIRQVIVKMREAGVAILLVEQRVDAVLSVADRVAFIENGQNGETLSADVLRADHSIVDRYVGV